MLKLLPTYNLMVTTMTEGDIKIIIVFWSRNISQIIYGIVSAMDFYNTIYPSNPGRTLRYISLKPERNINKI